jgi:hypothetical protein
LGFLEMGGTPRVFDGCGFFCVSHTPFAKPQSVPAENLIWTNQLV